ADARRYPLPRRRPQGAVRQAERHLARHHLSAAQGLRPEEGLSQINGGQQRRGTMQDRPPAWLWPRAAYIHVPFCAHHCGYCDFPIAVNKDPLIELYLDALSAELATLGTPQRLQTLFLGGGTPTYLSAPQLDRLLGDVNRWLPAEPGHEFTVEANPGTLDAEKVSVLADHGVTRVSLRAQSFHPHPLRVLERD